MKNLFDYAKKELSQDAFLRWFIENLNDENKDSYPRLRKAAFDFINFLMDENNNLDINKIRVKTFSQYQHIDITIDVYPDRDSDEHYVIAIEDKTESSEHNQLKKYNKTLESLKSSEHATKIYKVFYKTNILNGDDEQGIEIANNENYSEKWRKYDIAKIWKFFEKHPETESDVYNDYVNYIKKIYDAYNRHPNNIIEELSLSEWNCLINAKYKDIKPDERRCVWTGSYQGRYVSVCYEKLLKDTLDSLVVEIIIRNKNELTASFIHGFYINPKHHEWSINRIFESNLPISRKEQCDKIREALLDFVRKGNYQKVKSNALSRIAKVDDTYKAVTTSDALNKIDEWFKKLDELVEKVNDSGILKGLEYNIK